MFVQAALFLISAILFTALMITLAILRARQITIKHEISPVTIRIEGINNGIPKSECSDDPGAYKVVTPAQSDEDLGEKFRGTKTSVVKFGEETK